MDLLTLNMNTLNIVKSGKIVKLMSDSQILNVKTCELYMPFNISKFKKQWSTFEDYTIDCYVNNQNNSNSMEYVNKLNMLDNHILELTKKNLHIFGVSDVNVQCNYQPMYRDNKTFPKLIKLQLPRDTNGNFTTQFFDHNSKIVIVNEKNIDSILYKKVIFKALITCSKVWYYQNKIGTIWNVVQLKLSDTSSNEYNIIDKDDKDEILENDQANAEIDNEKTVYNKYSFLD